ncbi:MAG: CotH kinase family protein [Bacteroidales bacterium]|nr:CotH kinase family protein [Bacteroidales bacterium]
MTVLQRTILALAGICFFGEVHGQPLSPPAGHLFVDTLVPRIDISINPDSLQWLYDHPDSNQEFHASFIFNNTLVCDSIENIGFRLRGNTSRWAAKKSFKVSFNTFEPGRSYRGLEKMNLNGEHNDPSVIRAKLCWDLMRDFGLPAPRANHIALYINNNYFGLYIHVEHIDEEFMKSRFGNKEGNLFKCLWPADLSYLGEDPDLYKMESGDRRVYDLKTNQNSDDYSDLAHFISVLNNTPPDQLPCGLEEVFNLADYLKVAALDIFIGDWDGYIYNKNNFYLYHNQATGQFEYIPYDLDNTLGIDWFGRDWGTRDIYDWEQHGSELRPLYTRLMDHTVLHDQFSFYFNELITGFGTMDYFQEKTGRIRWMIAPYIETDPFYPLDYGYTITDFHLSFQEPLGGHVTYGLIPYVQVRISSALSQLQLTNIPPVIKYFAHNHPGPDSDLKVRAFVEDEDMFPEVLLRYRVNTGALQTMVMLDDGLHDDGMALDRIYGACIQQVIAGNTYSISVGATDGEGSYSIRPCDPATIQVIESLHPDLRINEFMASNSQTLPDEAGEYDDWIEIYNADISEVWLGDKYLSDDLGQPDRWMLPDLTLEPGAFLLIWADDDTQQGEYHANFKLDKDGEEIGIFDSESTGYQILDTVAFGSQTTDVSMGRTTDGGTEWTVFFQPTPGASNLTGSLSENRDKRSPVHIFPNPVRQGILHISHPVSLRIFDANGRQVFMASGCRMIDVSSLPAGLYYLLPENQPAFKFIISCDR